MKTKKTKKQIIAVPTAQKYIQRSKTKKSSVAVRPAPKTSSKTLSKSRSVHSKENTLTYYNCLIDQVANPLNDKVKITQMTHHCKCNKGKVEAARQEHKQQLVQKLAQSYKTFGESLGHYLHADIIGCAKELKK